jgi:hypothetical protein
MKRSLRWTMAILAAWGLQTAAAQAQSQPALHHASALDLAPLDQQSGPVSGPETDGNWYP